MLVYRGQGQGREGLQPLHTTLCFVLFPKASSWPLCMKQDIGLDGHTFEEGFALASQQKNCAAQ